MSQRFASLVPALCEATREYGQVVANFTAVYYRLLERTPAYCFW